MGERVEVARRGFDGGELLAKVVGETPFCASASIDHVPVRLARSSAA